MTHEELLELHYVTSVRCRRIMESKNKDYTGGSEACDPFANFRASETVGIHPIKGILLRMQDKIQRINSFANDGKLTVKEESVNDACEDIVNYAILIKAIASEEPIPSEERSY